MDGQATVTQTFVSEESGSKPIPELLPSTFMERSYTWWQKGVIW